MTTSWHKTQITYNAWNIPPQMGQVRRLTDGFEFSTRKWRRSLMLWSGPRTSKIIHDIQITAITHWPNRHGPGWIIIAFDRDDEIMLNDLVLADLDRSAVAYSVLVGSRDEGSSGTRLVALMKRQQSRGPVSWEHGRANIEGTTSTRFRLREMASMAALVATVVLVWLLK